MPDTGGEGHWFAESDIVEEIGWSKEFGVAAGRQPAGEICGALNSQCAAQGGGSIDGGRVCNKQAAANHQVAWRCVG